MGLREAPPAAAPEEVAEPRAESSGTRRAVVESLRLVALTRAIFFAAAAAASWLLAGATHGPPGSSFVQLWLKWDAVHFINIAERGYFHAASDGNASAFFPLLPLSIRTLSWTGLSGAVAGLVIAGLASAVACAYLWRLAEEELGAGAGRRACMYLLLFPTAVFLVAPYSEALFLAGAVAAFYYARRRSWHLAGLPAAVAVGSRAAGIFLVAGLAAEFLRQRDFSFERVANAALALLIATLPLLAYGAFLAQATGDPFHFLESQREGWGRQFVGPVSSFVNTWETWEGGYQTNWLLAWRLEIVAAATGVAFTVWAAAKREWGYAVFMATMLGALMTSSWYYSIPRMLLSLFPIPLLIAGATRGRDRLHEAVTIVFAPLATLGVVVYTQGLWFF